MLSKLWHLIGGDHAKFWPGNAAEAAGHLNSLSLYLLILSAFFIIGIFTLMIVFVIKYRRRHPDQLAFAVKDNLRLEIIWTLIPFLLIMVVFAWATKDFLYLSSPPSKAEAIYVTGKQWMWKFEHEDGLTENNELHVPVDRDIQLVMTSTDVIHSFFIPAFRMKYDVLPGRITHAWFHATVSTQEHLLCTQFCGADHSLMVGTVTTLAPADYAAWAKQAHAGQQSAQTLSRTGEALFKSKACTSCHDSASDPENKWSPSLHSLYGSKVKLANGQAITADEQYIRRSILIPAADQVAGYPSDMPPYAGQLSESDLFALIAYIRSLR